MAKDTKPVEEDESAAARKAAKRAKKLAKAQEQQELDAQEQAKAEKKAKKRSCIEEEVEEQNAPKKAKKEKNAASVAAEDDGDREPQKIAKELPVKSAPNVEQQEPQVFTAFVGGLRSHVDEEKIWADFAECGKVKEVILSRWPEDGSSKGMAFITFETAAALANCVKWHETNYEGAWIRVERKEGKAKQKDQGLGGQRGLKPEGCKAVAVLNLSKQATEDDIWKFFEDCGTVASVKIPRHRETYEPRGMAFVDFEDTLHTDKAVKLTGQSVAGQAVRVEYAAPKNDSSSGKGKGKGSKGPQTKPPGCLSVVVKNLSKSVTDDDLWHLIRECKSANNVSIMRDKDTWESRGFAFVDFDETDDTDKAVEQSGSELYGQPVSITFKM